MREVNFSIPNVNKASVGITTALYDRRALDCTSNLPIINSLNHLAYLTTSSARIREILTQDGGIERLICILKQGRSRDSMDTWKWNLAFQCVVNIGVRGTEDIRTRVVEADVVPVIATLLDGYHKITEKCREKAELAKQKHQYLQQKQKHKEENHYQQHPRLKHHQEERRGQELGQYNRQLERQQQLEQHAHRDGGQGENQIDYRQGEQIQQEYDHDRQAQTLARIPRSSSTINSLVPSHVERARSIQRQAPPPYIDISTIHLRSQVPNPHYPIAIPNTTPTVLPLATTPIDRNTGVGSRHIPPNFLTNNMGSLSAIPAQPTASQSPGVGHVEDLMRIGRDLDRQVPIYGSGIAPSPSPGTSTPFRNPILASQPTSPTTPVPHPQAQSSTADSAMVPGFIVPQRRRPSVRHQSSMSTESDDTNGDGLQSDESPDSEMAGIVNDMQPLDIQDISMDDTDVLLTQTGIRLAPQTVSRAQDSDTFNMTHQDPLDAMINHNNRTPGPSTNLSPTRPNIASTSPQSAQQAPAPRFLAEQFYSPPSEVVAAMPRDEDILMSLQLLAYVSKYCGLRTYFQKSHLVPKLKLTRELRILDIEDGQVQSGIDNLDSHGFTTSNEEEYLLPNDYNIFPLVEKFTVRLYSREMNYWAGVVMRNLCRKDDTRGGIRQCAYYQCGKWEEFPRQFAKCRRCRRTKYCSKDCQKSAWAFHRHWCISPS